MSEIWIEQFSEPRLPKEGEWIVVMGEVVRANITHIVVRWPIVTRHRIKVPEGATGVNLVFYYHDTAPCSLSSFIPLTPPEPVRCPNCGEELNSECACMRNKCIECGAPVGNITFTVCDDCWDHKKPTAAPPEPVRCRWKTCVEFGNMEVQTAQEYTKEELREISVLPWQPIPGTENKEGL